MNEYERTSNNNNHMKKIIDFTSWELLFPGFLFESLLPHMNVKDHILNDDNKSMYIELAHSLMSIYLEDIKKWTVDITDYSNCLLHFLDRNYIDKEVLPSQKFAVGICMMSFANFIEIHFPQQYSKSLTETAYKFMGLI